jgi:hypothetical protein
MYDIVQYALDNGYNVYYGQPMTEMWSKVFTIEDNGEEFLQKVSSINHNPDFSEWAPQ